MQTIKNILNDPWPYIIIVGLIYYLLRQTGLLNKFHLPYSKISSSDIELSLIMSYYTRGLGLMKLNRAKINNMRYTLYTTTTINASNENASLSQSGTLIYVLELPFNTQTHIVGMSKKYSIDDSFLGSFLQTNGMQETTLEGDFADKCHLYEQAGQGFLTQFVLDPKAMQFIINFCADNFWEIAGDELILIKTENQAGGTNLIDISTRFAQEIRPAIEQKGLPVNHEAPYGEYNGSPLPCPICKSPMTIQTNWLECTSGHGILINGRYVIQIRDKQLKVDETIEKPTTHNQIICPNCATPMQTVDYQNTGVLIDSCTKCPFRWLDATEAEKIVTKI